MASSSKMPFKPSIPVEAFRAHVSEEKLEHFETLLKLSLIGPATSDNTQSKPDHGITREWLENAKNVWTNAAPADSPSFSWRAIEDRINSFPNFKARLTDPNNQYEIDMQFLALFSTRPDAIPILLLHGYPSSICDFLDILTLLRTQYPDPSTLPYHIIVPSLPGYGYTTTTPSSDIPEPQWTIPLAASAIDHLMQGLGFHDSGYFVQGGDLGSFLARRLATFHPRCRGCHVNMMGIPPTARLDDPASLKAEQRECLAVMMKAGGAHAAMQSVQASRSGMLGLVLGASPLGLLAWVADMVLGWTTEGAVPLERLLEVVTLYWMTETMGRGMWHSRELVPDKSPLVLPYTEKPCGYSMFREEIVPVPKSWAEESCNLVFFKEHECGGHFAAMEKPGELLQDLEEYLAVVSKM